MKKKLLLIVAAVVGVIAAQKAKARKADDADLWTQATQVEPEELPAE